MKNAMSQDRSFEFPPQIRGDTHEEKVEVLFNCLDTNQDGKLTCDEMVDGLNRLVDEIFDSAIADLLEQMNMDHEGEDM